MAVKAVLNKRQFRAIIVSCTQTVSKLIDVRLAEGYWQCDCHLPRDSSMWALSTAFLAFEAVEKVQSSLTFPNRSFVVN